MPDLNIRVDGEVLKQARIRALEENTTVNAVLNRHLEEYSHLEEVQRSRRAALKRLLRIADAHPIDRGGCQLSRGNLHER